MAILIPVTEETNRQGVNNPFISKLYGVPFINKIRENGVKSTIILDGKRNDEERIVSESKSTIDALVSSGYLDFMFNLTVKNVSGSLNDDYPYSASLKASQIVEVYSNPETPSDSIVRYRDESKQEDTLYTVDEDLAAIISLMSSYSLSDVVSNGDTLSNGQAIKSNGGGELNLRRGLDGEIDITNDNGLYAKSWLYLSKNSATAQLGYKNTYVGIFDQFIQLNADFTFPANNAIFTISPSFFNWSKFNPSGINPSLTMTETVDISGSGLKIGAITAAKAASLTIAATEVLIVNVNTTDATFTSLGLWKNELGVWTKF